MDKPNPLAAFWAVLWYAPVGKLDGTGAALGVMVWVPPLIWSALWAMGWL